jgi:hypothetical protein
MSLENFHNLHKGETALFVGNGPNLYQTPPEWFTYPSIGTNTIHLYSGWKPTYYVTVDHEVVQWYGHEIAERLTDVPKFIPSPKLDYWQGPNFYRWKRRERDILTAGHSPKDPDALTGYGIAYYNVTHAALQILWHMGFATVLMIGVQHRPDHMTEHFWGSDPRSGNGPDEHNTRLWMDGYRDLVTAMQQDGVTVLNISKNTYVPVEVIPRDDWRKWTIQKE